MESESTANHTSLVVAGRRPLPPVRQTSLDAYIRAVNSIPILSAEEEKSLAEDYQKTGNVESAQKLVVSQLRFVVHIARSYLGYGLPLADLIQEGNIGLMQAVKRFDPGMGVRLVSFAVHWIKSCIHEYVIKNWRMVKVATTKSQRKLFFNLRKYKKSLTWFTPDEIAMVARELNVSPKDVEEMEQRMIGSDVAFDGYDDPAADDDTPQNVPALYLEDKSSDFARNIEDASENRFALSSLEKALGKLDERSRYIIQRRWFDENKATLQELAEHFGVSAERVRQLEKGALEKLKSMIGVSLDPEDLA